MSYIIGSKCVSICDTACVEVCPVDCIHGPLDNDGMGVEAKNMSKEELQNQQLYINPEDCIECGACLPECPVEAIFDSEEEAIENNEGKYIQRNYNFFKIEIPEEYKI